MTATYNARPGAAPGTTARVRYVRMSATKARAVLDLIRGQEVAAAEETLRLCERDAALVIGKLLHSAVANAEHNDDQIAEDLFISSCYADEGRTIRRFRPRARGRATRIRKRTCHITIVVSRLSEEQLERRRRRQESRPAGRARRGGQEAAEAAKAGRSRRRRRSKSSTDTEATPRAAEPATTAPEPSSTDTDTDTGTSEGVETEAGTTSGAGPESGPTTAAPPETAPEAPAEPGTEDRAGTEAPAEPGTEDGAGTGGDELGIFGDDDTPPPAAQDEER